MATAGNKQRSRKEPRASRELADAMAKAGWSEADAALAEAVVEVAQLEVSLGIASSAKSRVANALALVRQAIMRAARRRGLTIIGAPGAVVPFVPGFHELADPGSASPARVKILSVGIARGEEVLIPAMAKPTRSSRKRAQR